MAALQLSAQTGEGLFDPSGERLSASRLGPFIHRDAECARADYRHYAQAFAAGALWPPAAWRIERSLFHVQTLSLVGCAQLLARSKQPCDDDRDFRVEGRGELQQCATQGVQRRLGGVRGNSRPRLRRVAAQSVGLLEELMVRRSEWNRPPCGTVETNLTGASISSEPTRTRAPRSVGRCSSTPLSDFPRKRMHRPSHRLP